MCKYDKTHPDTASCTCKVYGLDKGESAWRNASVGPLTYDKSQPQMANGEIANVTSNFSFANLDNASQIASHMCSFDAPTPWANCFGVSCVTSKNENNELIAACECPVVKTASFVSMGPTQANECVQPEDKIWSSATIRQSDNAFAVIEAMYKKFYPNTTWGQA